MSQSPMSTAPQGTYVSQADTQPAERGHWPSRLLGLLLLLWMLGVTAVVQGVAWSSQQFAMNRASGGLSDPDFIAALVQAALLLLPLTPVAFLWTRPGYRTVFQTWFLAALFALIASVVHLPGAIQAYASVALQILVATVFAIALAVFDRTKSVEAPLADVRSQGLLIAATVSPLLLLPWADGGAPGGALEVVGDLIAAALFGLCAALLARRVARRHPAWVAAGARNRLFAGVVAFGALVPMSAAYGFGGNQVLMLLALPVTGLLAANVLGHEKEILSLALIFGLGAAGPLIFFDPREMALSLSFGLFSTLGLAFRAAILAFFLTLFAAAGLLVWRWLGRRNAGAIQKATPGYSSGRLLLAVPAWLLLMLVFAVGGHPAFYGDRLFVILRDQADVSEAQNLADSDQRRRIVYDTLVNHAQQSQASLRDTLAKFGFEATPYYLINALEVEGGPLLRLWLQNRPDVSRVLYSPVLRPAPPEGAEKVNAPEPTQPPWNVTMIGADAVWQEFGVDGTGIVIGQSDSGVQWDHPQLASSYRGAAGDHDYNWFDPWYGTRQPTDTGGHGTHTLGTVLGKTTGVAPGATWFACANLARNVGSMAFYLDCLQFMLAPFPLDGDPFQDGDPLRGADVLNNSWGCPDLEGCQADSMLPAVTALRHAGIFVVVSAGNDGPDCSTVNSPLALYDQVLSVGAIDRLGNITAFSSRGPVIADGSNRIKPDLVAPGLEILSAFPDNVYRRWQGTSMAGPHVAGVVALLWAANPQLMGDIDLTERILTDTAQPLQETLQTCSGGEGLPNNVFGYGMVDAYAAVRRALSLQSN